MKPHHFPARYEYYDSMRERELEKEHIRKEIIAEEMMRGRRLDIETQVRREMGMEQRSLAAHEGFPHYLPRRRSEVVPCSLSEAAVSPFSLQQPSEVAPTLLRVKSGESPKVVEAAVVGNDNAGNKVVIVSKPVTPGNKRKILVLGAVGDKLLSTVPSESEPQNDWVCDICQVHTSCENNLEEHFRGRMHKEIEEKKNSSSSMCSEMGNGSYKTCFRKYRRKQQKMRKMEKEEVRGNDDGE